MSNPTENSTDWTPLAGERVVWTGGPCELEGEVIRTRYRQGIGGHQAFVKWEDGQTWWCSVASLKSGEDS